jgi:uncharacterized repeat protein (TIGR02543 family)
MAWTFIASATGRNNASGTVLDASSTLNVQAGDLLVAMSAWANASPSSFKVSQSDGTTNLMTSLAEGYDNTGYYSRTAYKIAAVAASAATFRLTLGTSVSYRSLIVLQFRPTSGASVTLETGPSYAYGNSTTIASGLFSTTGTDEVIIGGMTTENNVSSSGYQVGGAAADGSVNTLGDVAAWYKIATSAQSSIRATGATSPSDTFGCHALSFKAVAGSSWSVAISESASASDAMSETTTNSGSVSEVGSASDAVSETVTGAASITEAGSASDTVSKTTTNSGAISESGSALDAPSVLAPSAIAESGSASDMVSETTTNSAAISEATSASDTASGTTQTLLAFIDHETGNLSQYTRHSGAQVSVVGAAAHDGSYGLKILASTSEAEDAQYVFGPTYTELWSGEWIYIDPGMRMNQNDEVGLTYLTEATETFFAYLCIRRFAAGNGFPDTWDTGNTIYDTSTFSAGWHYVQLHLKVNSTQGKREVWVDHTLIRSTTDDASAYPKITYFNAGNDSVSLSASGTMYFDTIGISNVGPVLYNPVTAAIAESASASDIVSEVVSGVASIAEAGSASDTVSETTTGSGAVSEIGSVTDAASASVSVAGALAESGSAQDSSSASFAASTGIVIGINAGFVASRPAANLSANVIDSDSFAQTGKFTAPAGAVLLSEVGFYVDNTPGSGNFRVGVYADSSGSPGTLLASGAATAVAQGWNHAAVSCSLTPGTVYHLAVQLDSGPVMNTAYTDSTTADNAFKSGQVSLPDPFGTPSFTLSRTPAIYGLYSSNSTAVVSEAVSASDLVSIKGYAVISETGNASDIVTEKTTNTGAVSEVVSAADTVTVLTSMSVSYFGNGSSSGSVPIDTVSYFVGDTAVVLDRGALARTGYVFVRWTTSADGTGSVYQLGDKIDMTSGNVSLYAQWLKIVGLPRDGNGWTQFTPAATSRIVYVSASGSDVTGRYYAPTDAAIGSDPRNPTGTVLPFATFAVADGYVRSGYADYVLFKRGDKFTDVAITPKSGQDDSNFFVYSSYGSGALPMVEPVNSDTALIALNLGGNSLQRTAFADIDFYAEARDPTSPSYNASFGGPPGFSLMTDTGTYRQILIEGCRFRFFTNNIMQLYGTEAGSISEITMRRVHFLDNWYDDAHAQGMYAHRLTGIFAEECVFDHNGWYTQSPGTPGTGTVYNHNTYFSDCRNVFFKHNVFMRSSSIHNKFTANDGTVDEAGPITCYENLYVDGEIGIELGGNIDTPYKFFSPCVSRNVFTEIGRSRPSNRTLGWDMYFDDWDGGSFTQNVCVANSNASVTNVIALYFTGGCRNARVDSNIVYNLSKSGQATAAAITVDNANTKSGISVKRNIIQQPGQVEQMVNFANAGDVSGFVFAANKYYSTTSLPFIVGGVAKSLADWKTQSGDTSTSEQVYFPDATRAIETYQAYIGGTTTIDAFLTAQRAKSRDSWPSNYDAATVDDWLRSGFVASGPATAVMLENCAASDTVAEMVMGTASMFESASAADSITKSTVNTVTLTESAIALDTVSEKTSGSGAVAESASASDSVNETAGATVAITESVSASETITKIAGASSAVSEHASAADTVGKTTTGSASIVESSSASEVITKVTQGAGVIAEAASASDAVFETTAGVGAVAEAASAADAISEVTGGNASVVETAHAASTVSETTANSTQVNEAASASEHTSKMTVGTAEITEIVDLVESFRGDVSKESSISESGSLSDAVSQATTGSGLISEVLHATVAHGAPDKVYDQLGTFERTLPDDLGVFQLQLAEEV